MQNIVPSADPDSVLNLNAITIGPGREKIEYGPEQFPGLGHVRVKHIRLAKNSNIRTYKV